MKKLKIIAIGLGITLAASCSNSATEDFEQENGDVAKKRMKNITITQTSNPSEKASVDFIYDSKNKLEKLVSSDGNRTSSVNYENNGSSISASENTTSDKFNLEKLYESPYDAFETGNIVEYDGNKNPSKLVFHQEEYDYNTDTFKTKDYTAEIFYDDAPNMFFYTLEAAGIIEILDGISLNFGIKPQVSEIVKARALFPVNNPNKIIYKDDKDKVVYTITLNYTYDADKYPTKLSVTAGNDKDVNNSETSFTYFK